MKTCKCQEEKCGCARKLEGGEWMKIHQVVLGSTSHVSMIEMIKEQRQLPRFVARNVPKKLEKLEPASVRIEAVHRKRDSQASQNAET